MTTEKKRTTASSNARTVNDSYRCRRRLFIQHNFHEKFDIEFVVSLFVQNRKTVFESSICSSTITTSDAGVPFSCVGCNVQSRNCKQMNAFENRSQVLLNVL